MTMRFDLDTCGEILDTITRNKTRSLLTAFGIFWGIFMLVVLTGGGQGVQDMMYTQFEGFATNSGFIWPQPTGEAYQGFQKGRRWSMTTDDIDRLKKRIGEIEVITPVVSLWGNQVSYNSKKTSCNVKGMRPDYNRIEYQRISMGRFLNEMDEREARKVCVIGKRIYENLFAPGTDPCGHYIQVDSVSYQIVGLCLSEGNVSIQGSSSNSVILPFSTMQRTYNLGKNIELACFTVREGIRVSDIQDRITAVVKQAHYVSPDDRQAVMMLNTESMFSMVDNLFTGIRILVWMIGLGTLLAGAIGVSNILMVTVRERTPEIGIRRAIGARPKDILFQILAESMVITTLAGLCGISFGVGVLQVLEQATADGHVYHFQVEFGTALGTLALLVALGLVAGLAPAYRALSVKPIDAIRDE